MLKKQSKNKTTLYQGHCLECLQDIIGIPKLGAWEREIKSMLNGVING